MSFLESSETNLIMDVPNIGVDPRWPQFTFRAIPLDDLKRFRDVGVQTVLQFAPWCEPRRGVYDWRLVDEMVERDRTAGLKTLLMGPGTVPLWCPASWYVHAADGSVMCDHDARNPIQSWGCLSPWSRDAQAYQLRYVERFTRRYNSADVLCLQSHSQEGESVLPPATPCIYDPAARESYRRFTGHHNAIPDAMTETTQRWMYESCSRVIIDLQRIYATHPSRTISMQLHPCYLARNWVGSGVYDVESYLRSVKEVVHPDTMLWFLFAWFSKENGKHVFEKHFPFVQRVMRELDLEVITGSEWPEGVVENTPKSIESGFRALLTAPLHPYLHRESIEPWVFDVVRQSHEERAQVRVIA